MAPVPKRGRSGKAAPGARQRATLGTLDLAEGLRGLAGVAGNQAMIGMLARSKGSALELPGHEEAEPGLEDREGVLAVLRLLLDGAGDLLAELGDGDGAKERYAELIEYLEKLLGALHTALESSPGYDGSLARELEELEGLAGTPGKHRLEAALEMLEILAAQGDKIHGALAGQLPTGDGDIKGDRPPELPAKLVGELKRRMKEPRERLRADKPRPDSEHGGLSGAGLAGAGGGLGIADLLGRKKKRRKQG